LSSKILMVEDDAMLCEMTMDYFLEKSEGEMVIEAAGNGKEAIGLIKNEKYDLVLLDVMLPGADGFTVCREIRKSSNVPVIFLTARVLEEDKLTGYGCGGDDYVTKPFSIAELFAKSGAVIRRASGKTLNDEIICGNIRISPATGSVTADGKEISLAYKEYEILRLMIRNKNIILSRDDVLDAVWGESYFGTDRVVDNHIRKLRKALGASGKQIKTVLGKGYKISE